MSAALMLALALLAPGHNRSEGRSRFALDAEGRVAIEIQIGYADVPELCNADLLVSDDRRAEMEQRLTHCLATDLPTLLRLKGDGRPCPVAYDRFDATPAPVGGGTLKITASADCGALPHALQIDWGLFAAGALDHVSVATLQQPYEDPKLAMLSRRSSRLQIDVARPRWPVFVGAGLALVVVAVGLGLAARLIARGRRRG